MACSVPSRWKSGGAFFRISAMQTMENRVIVVDKNNRPLCCLGRNEAAAQGLVWRETALFLTGSGGRGIFLWKNSLEIDLPVCGAQPAFQEPGEFCLIRLRSLIPNVELALKRFGIFPPCPENGGAFTTLYLGSLPRFTDSPQSRLFLADMDEIAGLEKHGCVVNPFLKMAWAEIAGHGFGHVRKT